LDIIAYLASNEIEKTYHGIAVPIPSDGPYDYWDEKNLEGRGIISIKHAAILAGNCNKCRTICPMAFGKK
jgi:hypothetical protein